MAQIEPPRNQSGPGNSEAPGASCACLICILRSIQDEVIWNLKKAVANGPSCCWGFLKSGVELECCAAELACVRLGRFHPAWMEAVREALQIGGKHHGLPAAV